MIANSIMEALARKKMGGEARQIVDIIIRETYGYHRKAVSLTLADFSIKTGLPKPSICRAINKTVNDNIINKTVNDKHAFYSFNKDFDTWKSLTNSLMINKTVNDSINKTVNVINKTVNETPSKINSIKGNGRAKESSLKKKDIKKTYRVNPDIKKFIDTFFEAFKTIFGKSYKVIDKDAKIVQGLLRTYEYDGLVELMGQFFESGDEFVIKAGYTIPVFSSQINKLISQKPKKQDEEINYTFKERL